MNLLEHQRVVLERTHSLLADPDHWVKGLPNIATPGGGIAYCLTRAITVAANEEMTWREIEALYYRIVREIDPVKRSSDVTVELGIHLARFNDRYDTEHKDVLGVIERATKGVIAEIEAT